MSTLSKSHFNSSIEAKSDESDSNKLMDKPDPQMTLDIVINNVVCSFGLRCHLDLRRIALTGANVEYRRENGMVTMKIRKPHTTASMWSSGKVTCTGATSEDMAKVAARRFARLIQKMGFRVHLNNYRVVNVLGTCIMPFAIKIIQFSQDNKANASYEPELHPGVTYKIKEPKATMKIFSTGSITVTAPSVGNVQAAIEHIFPIVYQYRKDKPIDSGKANKKSSNSRVRNNAAPPTGLKRSYHQMDDADNDNSNDLTVDEDYDSDHSCD